MRNVKIRAFVDGPRNPGGIAAACSIVWSVCSLRIAVP